MAIGIDVGNGYTKFCNKKFASRVKIGTINKFGRRKNEIHNVEYEGVNYIVGDGSIFTGDNRYFTKEYEICLLTAIALGCGKDFPKESIVVGLPEKKQTLLGNELETHLKEIGQKQITVDGTKYTIRIEDAIVFIEGAYPILESIEDNVIVIDNGAGTINVSQWEDLSILNSQTYNEAIYKMYADISGYLNDTKGSEFKPIDVQKFFNDTTTIINQEEVDISDTRKIITSHIREIASYIKNDFEYKSAKSIFLIGGAGADTITYWQEEFPNIKLIKDAQFINSRIYDAIAKDNFGEDEKYENKKQVSTVQPK